VHAHFNTQAYTAYWTLDSALFAGADRVFGLEQYSADSAVGLTRIHDGRLLASVNRDLLIFRNCEEEAEVLEGVSAAQARAAAFDSKNPGVVALAQGDAIEILDLESKETVRWTGAGGEILDLAPLGPGYLALSSTGVFFIQESRANEVLFELDDPETLEIETP